MTTQTPQPELDKLAKANKLVEKRKQALETTYPRHLFD